MAEGRLRYPLFRTWSIYVLLSQHVSIWLFLVITVWYQPFWKCGRHWGRVFKTNADSVNEIEWLHNEPYKKEHIKVYIMNDIEWLHNEPYHKKEHIKVDIMNDIKWLHNGPYHKKDYTLNHIIRKITQWTIS